MHAAQLLTSHPCCYAGKGIQASIGAHTLLLGSPALLASEPRLLDVAARIATLVTGPQSLVCLALDGDLAGVVALTDCLRAEAATLVQDLESRGVHCWVASGDNAATVAALATALNLPQERAKGGLTPQDKAALVSQLQQGGRLQVAMVGDGVNDSVALTAADVGIAMGAGTAVAMDCADVVVKAQNLTRILTLIDLSVAARRRILVNFGWAAAYNIIAMPLAAGVLFPAVGRVIIPPAFAGLSELLSSVPVVLGSLLLYRFKDVQMA